MIAEPYEFQHATLACGLETYWRHKPEAHYLKIGVLIWVGNIDNPLGKEGLAHFFEHLPFRGTEKYPSKRELVHPVESEGGSIGANTSSNVTEFFTQVKTGSGRKGWKRLEQMLFHPLLRQRDVDAELPVIEAEIAQWMNGRSIGDELRQQTLIGGEEFARSFQGLGRPESLRPISLDDLHAFHREHYVPANMTVVAVGNLDEFVEEWETFLEGRFARFTPAARKPRRVIIPIVGDIPAAWESTNFPTRQPFLSVCGPLHRTGAVLDDDLSTTVAPAMAIIGERLWSGDFSSVFLHELREKRSIVYSFSGRRTHMDQNLAWWSFGGLFKRSEDVTVALDLLKNELIQPRQFSDRAVERMKRSLIGSHHIKDFGCRSVYGWAYECLREDRRIMVQQEWQRRIAETTPDEVRSCVERYLDPSRWIVTTFLPSG